MSTPSLTELRDEIARLCDDVAVGRLTLQTVFTEAEDDDAPLANNYVYVVKLIERIPGVGKVKARRILSELDISERCHVGDLTPEQRSIVVQQVAQS
jgi:hypothetical protein